MSPFQTEKPAYSETDRKRYQNPVDAHNAAQDAMKEIEKILKDYGLGGFVALHADYGPQAQDTTGIIGLFCSENDLIATTIQIDRSFPGTLETVRRINKS